MLLTLAPIVLVCAAQQPVQPSIELLPTSGAPQFAGVYHPAIGLRKEPNLPRLGPQEIWNSHTLSNYYTIPGEGQEWIDEGILPSRHAQQIEQVNGFKFTYCSSDMNPNGTTNQVQFYDETVVCMGPTDWPSSDCSYVLGGLPGGSGNGNLACWTVMVDLAGFECELPIDPMQQKLFGWSQTWDNDHSGPWIASRLPPGGDCSWVWFDTTAPNRNAAFQGCFWFGCFPPEQFTMSLYGQPDDVFAIAPTHGPGDDMTLALEAQASARGGLSTSIRLIDLATGNSQAGSLFASAAPAEIDLQARFGIDATLLLDANQLRWRSYSSIGSHTTPIFPPSAQGKSVFVQGVQLANARPTRLTAHALEMIVQ